ncbi:hypothetical protein [Candidatus Palauibacter sp.]|uniref:hypothetical protein n=1 Tax=Candidatus Palauibacter sp. TaxID=3101350 RepID=UPI003B02A0F6
MKLRRVLAHVAAIVGLYLVFSFALFLGLQVDPVYGNIGLLVTALLVIVYIYIGFVRRRAASRRSRGP